MIKRLRKIEGVKIIAVTLILITVLALVYVFVVVDILGSMTDSLIDQNATLRYNIAAADKLDANPASKEGIDQQLNEAREAVLPRIEADAEDLQSIISEHARQSGLEDFVYEAGDEYFEYTGDSAVTIVLSVSDVSITAKGSYKAGRDFLKLTESFESGIFRVESFAFSEGTWMYQLTFIVSGG